MLLDASAHSLAEFIAERVDPIAPRIDHDRELIVPRKLVAPRKLIDPGKQGPEQDLIDLYANMCWKMKYETFSVKKYTSYRDVLQNIEGAHEKGNYFHPKVGAALLRVLKRIFPVVYDGTVACLHVFSSAIAGSCDTTWEARRTGGSSRKSNISTESGPRRGDQRVVERALMDVIKAAVAEEQDGQQPKQDGAPLRVMEFFMKTMLLQYAGSTNDKNRVLLMCNLYNRCGTGIGHEYSPRHRVVFPFRKTFSGGCLKNCFWGVGKKFRNGNVCVWGDNVQYRY